MKVLSIKQPWAFAILKRGKDVENRTWTTNYRGRLYIHGSRSTELAEIKACQAILQKLGKDARRTDDWLRSGILGYVDLVDIVTDSTSAWAIPGQYHWILDNPKFFFNPIRIPGQLNLWTPPEAIRQQVEFEVKYLEMY